MSDRIRKTDGDNTITHALWGVFESPNEADSNLEPANVVDGLFAIARAIHRLAEAAERLSRRPS